MKVIILIFGYFPRVCVCVCLFCTFNDFYYFPNVSQIVFTDVSCFETKIFIFKYVINLWMNWRKSLVLNRKWFYFGATVRQLFGSCGGAQRVPVVTFPSCCCQVLSKHRKSITVRLFPFKTKVQTVWLGVFYFGFWWVCPEILMLGLFASFWTDDSDQETLKHLELITSCKSPQSCDHCVFGFFRVWSFWIY